MRRTVWTVWRGGCEARLGTGLEASDDQVQVAGQRVRKPAWLGQATFDHQTVQCRFEAFASAQTLEVFGGQFGDQVAGLVWFGVGPEVLEQRFDRIE